MADPVEHPSHYTQGRIEVIDFIEDQDLNFHLGNCVKYICRAKHKGEELRDLQKARWYLNRSIQKLVLLRSEDLRPPGAAKREEMMLSREPS